MRECEVCKAAAKCVFRPHPTIGERHIFVCGRHLKYGIRMSDKDKNHPALAHWLDNG